MPRHLSVTVGRLPGPRAPTGPFQVGVRAGVPAGTTLTDTVGLGDPDTTGLVTLTDLDQTVQREALIWQNRRWTHRLSPHPDAGDMWLFDRCEIDVTLGPGEDADNFFALDVIETNAREDRTHPLVVLRDCTLLGAETHRVIQGNYLWMERCHVRGPYDAWLGLKHSTAIGCNLIATLGSDPEAHADAVQTNGSDDTLLYRSWLAVGTGEAANSAFRAGVELGDVTRLRLLYCGLSGGQYTLQIRGDGDGVGDVDQVEVRGCRIEANAVFGPVDLAEVTHLTWADVRLMDGTLIPSPL